MKKFIYPALTILYLLIIVIWCYRFPLSYKVTTGINPNLITQDLTNKEREGVENALKIRQAISNTLLYSSAILALGSYIALRVEWLKPTLLIRSVFIVSVVIAFVLMIVNGIHFIPTGIR